MMPETTRGEDYSSAFERRGYSVTKIGVWLIGARGSLASTVVLGARALAQGLATGGGLVTATPELAPLGLVAVGDLTFGGWDIARSGLVAQARTLACE